MPDSVDSLVQPLPEPYDQLRIDAAVVYTADPQRPVIEGGSVLVSGSTITAVGTAAEIDAIQAELADPGHARRIDARNRMVLPGLINDHWHEASALRAASGLAVDPDDSATEPSLYADGGDMRGMTMLFDSFRGLTASMPDEVAQLAALESFRTQLRAGTTTVADFGSINHPDIVASTALATGLRAVVTAYGADGVIEPGSSAFTRTVDTGEVLAASADVLKRWDRHPSGRLRAMPSLLFSLGASDELMQGTAELAADFDTPMATHIAAASSETATSLEVFGVRAVERWQRLGLLSDRVVSAHTAFADPEEFAWLLDAGVHVTHCPHRYGATGENTITTTRQILQFLAAGAPVSLSTDGDPLPLGNMPEAMRMAWLAYNEAAGDPTTVTPMRALSMATLQGARALRWEDEIGSLTAGKKADLFTIPVDDFRYIGLRRPLQAFLSAGSSGDVDMVVADGRVLVENRSLTFIDEAALSEAFLSASTGLARAIGVPLP